MFKLFLALNFLLINLFACKGGFDTCRLKTNDSNSIIKQTLQIPLKSNQKLVFSKNKPDAKIIKYDPYLSIYLIEDNKNFKYPFRLNDKLSLGTAVVNNKIVKEGKIIKKQIGLNSLGKYSENISAPSLLLNSCCALEGLVTPNGIIEKEYIERFLKIEKISYADIGIRVVDEKKLVIVDVSNPFIKKNKFKKGDCILELNGKKVKDSASFMKDILFAKIGVIHKIKIKRGAKVMSLSAKSQNRYGGGFLSDTFLEFFGLHFDKDLYLTKIEKKALKYQLKLEDKLLGINGEKIKNKEDILEILANSKKSSYLLFQRGQFQFFVTLN